MRYLPGAMALTAFLVVHEGLHALLGLVWGETVGFAPHLWGFEVLFRTSVAERAGLRWAVISGLPNVVTVAIGYVLFASRVRLRGLQGGFARPLGYWSLVLFLLLDPFNLSIASLAFGGDVVGVAVGLGVPVGVVQGGALVLLLANRELVVRRVLPLWGIRTKHPLFRPLPLGRPGRAPEVTARRGSGPVG